MNTMTVPKIEITGRTARSNAAMPRHKCDTAACWSGSDRSRAKSLMSQPGEIQCTDATAFIGMTAIGLDMLYQCREVKARLVKAYEV